MNYYGIDDLLEVKLRDAEAFLQIKETLTRIGVANFDTKTLYQSCHILHKQGRYFIVHFKELFALDGKCTREHFYEEDKERRNRIALLLEDWNMLRILKPVTMKEGSGRVKVFVLKYKEAHEMEVNEEGKSVPVWTREEKYTIGKEENKENA